MFKAFYALFLCLLVQLIAAGSTPPERPNGNNNPDFGRGRGGGGGGEDERRRDRWTWCRCIPDRRWDM